MPMAAPRTSATSVAMAANSEISHSPKTTGREKWSRHTSARFLPVAMPSLAESVWMSMAIKLLATTTHSSK